jgi:hypothetical protein
VECNKCGKEITLNNGAVYCPYCGVKLKGEDTPKRKSIWTRQLKIGDGVKAFIVWLLLCVIVVPFFGLVKWLVSARFGLDIAGLADWIVVCLIGAIALYFTLAYVVYHHAKKHHRRAVAWATAFVVFTPVLGGLAYLLSWPKELGGEEQ